MKTVYSKYNYLTEVKMSVLSLVACSWSVVLSGFLHH